jgi:hypothetical protein
MLSDNFNRDLEQQWLDFVAETHMERLTEPTSDLHRMLRKSFLAGFASCFSAMCGMAELPTDEAARRLETLRQEILVAAGR